MGGLEVVIGVLMTFRFSFRVSLLYTTAVFQGSSN